MKIKSKLWIGVIALVILSPLGLVLPQYFKSGSAWGEWGIDEMRELVGYVPCGLKKFTFLWNAPMPDYVFKGWEQKGLMHLSFSYIVSAVLGLALVVAVIYFIGKFLIKGK